MLAAKLISEHELELAIEFARFINTSIGRALVMQGIVGQESLDLAIDVSLLVRGNRLRREKALEMLRFEHEIRRLQKSKDCVIKYIGFTSEIQLPEESQPAEQPHARLEFSPGQMPAFNPLMSALQGVFARNPVFHGR